MYNIIYVGRYVKTIVDTILNFKDISVMGVILDDNVDDIAIAHDRLSFTACGLKEYSFSEIDELNPDLILVPYYTKLIKSSLINKYLFINIHSGILPKWRGFNSNCWAILNGEKQVGYTMHRIRKGMDSGEIYKIIAVEVKNDIPYINLRDMIQKKLCKELEVILCGILDGNIKPISVPSTDVVYNCSLRPSDGEIRDWNNDTAYFLRLMQVFGAPPFGTGVKMYIDGQEYIILKMKRSEGIASSIGITGSVVNKYDDKSVLIKTRDTAVRVFKLQLEGKIIYPGDKLMIGKRL